MGRLVWYRNIRVLETIKTMVIKGKFLVGFSSLSGITGGKMSYSKDTIMIK